MNDGKIRIDFQARHRWFSLHPNFISTISFDETRIDKEKRLQSATSFPVASQSVYFDNLTIVLPLTRIQRSWWEIIGVSSIYIANVKFIFIWNFLRSRINRFFRMENDLFTMTSFLEALEANSCTFSHPSFYVKIKIGVICIHGKDAYHRDG